LPSRIPIRWQHPLAEVTMPPARAAHGLCYQKPFEVAIEVTKAVLGARLAAVSARTARGPYFQKPFEGATDFIKVQEPMVNDCKDQISDKTSLTIAFTFTSVEPGSS